MFRLYHGRLGACIAGGGSKFFVRDITRIFRAGTRCYVPPTLASMADLLSLSIRRTSGSDGRSAMRAMSSGNSYHLRPHCTKRAASAMTCARATSEGPSRSDGAAGVILRVGLPLGRVGLAGGLLADFAAGLAAGMAALRSVRATCAVPAGCGMRLAARNFGISRVAVAETAGGRAASSGGVLW